MDLAYSETNGKEMQEKGKLEDKKLKVGERRREQRARPVRIQNMSRLRRGNIEGTSAGGDEYHQQGKRYHDIRRGEPRKRAKLPTELDGVST